MNDILKLFSTIAGSTLLATIISDLLARHREKHSRKRTKIEEMSKLYEEALSLLELSRRSRCLGDAAREDALVRLQSRLDLKAPTDIREQFDKAGWALEAWASQINQAEKPGPGGVVIISSGMQAVRDEAARLLPLFELEAESLSRLMRAHLARLEGKDGDP